MHLTPRDAARLLGVTEAALDRWLRSGELVATRVNDRWRLNRVDLLEFAASRSLDVSPDLLAPLEAAQLPGLAEAIRAGGVHRGISGKDKSAVLRAVVDRLPLPGPGETGPPAPGPARARGARLDRVRERDRHPPRAQPHRPARSPGPRWPSATSTPPVDFEALDGKPVHTLFTVVSSSTRTHLHFLALIAQALHDPAVLAKLEARAGADELLPEVVRVEAAIAARRAAGASTP